MPYLVGRYERWNEMTEKKITIILRDLGKFILILKILLNELDIIKFDKGKGINIYGFF